MPPTGGGSWTDASALFTHNGYNGTIYDSATATNPFKGRPAFTGESNAYISSRLSLAPLAGQSVRFRFRMGTDDRVDAWGWFIDDVRIYTLRAASTPTPTPTPTATPRPSLTLSSNSLSFLADGGTDPSPQTLAIGNGGGGGLTWSAMAWSGIGQAGLPWLSLSPGSGTAPATVRITVDKAQIAPGIIATARIRVDGISASTQNTPQYVDVAFGYVSGTPSRAYLPVVLRGYGAAW